MSFSQKRVLLAGISLLALLLILVSAGCSQSEEGSGVESIPSFSPSPGVTPSAPPSQRPCDAGSLSDLETIVARYQVAHPSGDNDTALVPGSCGDYSKTGEFVEVAGGLFDLVREDPGASRLLSAGGEIAGVVVVCPPTAATEPVGPGCYPAVRVRYGELTIDFLVNIDCMCIEKTSIEVPPGYLSHTVDNVT
ncbi:MAG: hypothetical protein PHT99_08390, partial [Methanoregula sp.]|nr:hypothetical protein [Methanoregula sp.]